MYTRDSVPRLRATPRVLSIAGTDPTGGAGVQADLKSIAANGGYGMAVVTALVAQNTRGVRAIHTPPSDFLRQQLDAVSDDVEIDAVKIGMLGEVSVIRELRSWLQTNRPPVLVLDPVLVATSGDRLLEASAEQALRDLVPLVDMVTPNIPELAILLDEPAARNWAEAVDQGKRLSSHAGVTVLVKGGHLTGADCPDALVNTNGGLDSEVIEVVAPRIATGNTHGTGCSLSSAMATVQARTGDWGVSLTEVKSWLQGALLNADALQVGTGNGPIDHFHRFFVDQPPAVDEFTELLWRDIESIREAIYDLPFVRALGDGTLSDREFTYYLAQDALYLGTYSRVLSRASALAPDDEAQLFWANAAQLCLRVESELHRRWLREHRVERSVGAVTKAYLDHLVASSAQGSYAALVAAILPCYWLYADVGARLHAKFISSEDAAAHPYRDWLATYADDAFTEAARRAIALTDAAAREASPRERLEMRAAFRHSAQFEFDFFEAPRNHASV